MSARRPILACATVALGALALNAALAVWVPGVRIDLTQESLYTISPGMRPLLLSLDEPVRIDLYWTRRAGEGAPQIRAHAQRVTEFLREVESLSGGMAELRIIDPAPFSDAEDEARAAGIAALSVDGVGGTLMLGATVSGPTDRRETIAYISPDRESFLEYDIATAIATVGRARKGRIGILSGMPLSAPAPQDPAGPPGAPREMATITELKRLFDVVEIGPSAPELPDRLDALMIVQPRALGEPTLRAIDSWIVGGKPTVILADPYAETDSSPDAKAMGASRSGTTYDFPLLQAYGIDIPRDMVVGDQAFATRVQFATPNGGSRTIDYLAWLSLDRTALNPDDPLVGGISAVNLMSAGAIVPVQGSPLAITPILSSSDRSELVQTLKIGFFGDPEQLLRDMRPDGQRRTLAARIAGPARSPFTGREGPISLVLIADADLLADMTWLSTQRQGDSLTARAVSDNGPLIVNAAELASGDSALANLRGRGQYRRPFAEVEAMRKSAEAKYVAREKDLEREIRIAEMRVAQLAREPGSESAAMVLTAGQQEELAQANRKLLDMRRELRQVQFRLREEIDALGLRVLVANVILWPSAVAAAALVWYLLRGRTAR
ncbi:MAG: hypothetical protein FGM37_03150 [Phycisphaerales bacterium]|nr:hypothetical protein [Phycisphaerales bacterium]